MWQSSAEPIALYMIGEHSSEAQEAMPELSQLCGLPEETTASSPQDSFM